MQSGPITEALARSTRGLPGAQEALWELVYGQMRDLAESRLRTLPAGQTVQATVLVHGAWMRLQGSGDLGWDGRAHFFGAAARAMRNILVDHARARHRLKRGGGLAADELTVSLADQTGPDPLDLLALDEALDALAADHPESAEILLLRFFGGLESEEIAELRGVSRRTIDRELLFGRSWLRRFLDRQ